MFMYVHLSWIACFIRTLRLPHTNCSSLIRFWTILTTDGFTHGDDIKVEINKAVRELYSLASPVLEVHGF